MALIIIFLMLLATMSNLMALEISSYLATITLSIKRPVNVADLRSLVVSLRIYFYNYFGQMSISFLDR